MTKFARLLYCSQRLLLLFLIPVLLASTSLANRAQGFMFAAGYNLGLMEARINAVAQMNPEWPLPSFIEERNAQNIRNVAEYFRAAEGLREPLFNTPEVDTTLPSGRLLTPRDRQSVILRLVEQFGPNTEKMDNRQKVQYVKRIVGLYKDYVGLTYVSSREDEFQSKPNCDSKLIDVGYHLGRAAGASELPSRERKQVKYDRYQRLAFAAMRSVIDAGLRLSVDGFAPGRASDNVTKICCSFGSSEVWKSFTSRYKWDMSPLEYNEAFETKYFEIRATEIPAGRCGGTGQDDERNYSYYTGEWYYGRIGQPPECFLTLTDRLVTRPVRALVIENCRSQTLWFFDEQNRTINFLGTNGRLTVRFRRITDDYWEGDFFLTSGGTYRTYLSRRRPDPRENSMDGLEGCQWLDPTTDQNLGGNCQCFCDGRKSADSRCKGPKPSFPNFCPGSKGRVSLNGSPASLRGIFDLGTAQADALPFVSILGSVLSGLPSPNCGI